MLRRAQKSKQSKRNTTIKKETAMNGYHYRAVCMRKLVAIPRGKPRGLLQIVSFLVNFLLEEKKILAQTKLPNTKPSAPIKNQMLMRLFEYIKSSKGYLVNK